MLFIPFCSQRESAEARPEAMHRSSHVAVQKGTRRQSKMSSVPRWELVLVWSIVLTMGLPSESRHLFLTVHVIVLYCLCRPLAQVGFALLYAPFVRDCRSVKKSSKFFAPWTAVPKVLYQSFAAA